MATFDLHDDSVVVVIGSSAAGNATPTIVALAIRQAEHINSRMTRGEV